MSFQSENQRRAFAELLSATRWDIVRELRNSELDYTICGLAERTQKPEITIRAALNSLSRKGKVEKYKHDKTTYYKWIGK